MIQLSNYLNIKIFFNYLVLSFPITFVIGSALVNLYLILFLIYFILNFKKIYINSNQNIFKITILFWIYLVLNTIFNNYKLQETYNIENIVKSIFFIRILILPVLFNFLIKEYDLQKSNFFKIIIIISLIISLDIIFQFFVGYNILGFESYNKGMRNSSFFNDELISGSYLYHFYLFLFYFFFKDFKNEYKKIFYFFFPLITIIGITLSGERMALINSYFAILLLVLFSKNKKILIAACILIISIFLLLVNSEKIFDRYVIQTKSQTLISNNLSNKFFDKLQNGIHYKLISSSFELSKPNILFGNGFKSYRYNCKSKNKENSSCSTHPHNLYAELIHDAGLIGTGIFILYLIFLVKSSFKYMNNDNLLFFCIFLTLINPFQITGSIFSTWKSSIMFLIFSFVYNKNDKFK